ncbi:hypothetical protein ACFFWC_24005 [Plantactinospora siamensis]|uniref:Uncharacterized protein n=1 Tax=Plantactinospora siamensis TaxID=555372 RepID=A0ABV6P7D1_9ACTN
MAVHRAVPPDLSVSQAEKPPKPTGRTYVIFITKDVKVPVKRRCGRRATGSRPAP